MYYIDKCVVYAVSEEIETAKNCFGVTLPGSDEPILLRAANEEIMNKWKTLFGDTSSKPEVASPIKSPLGSSFCVHNVTHF